MQLDRDDAVALLWQHGFPPRKIEEILSQCERAADDRERRAVEEAAKQRNAEEERAAREEEARQQREQEEEKRRQEEQARIQSEAEEKEKQRQEEARRQREQAEQKRRQEELDRMEREARLKWEEEERQRREAEEKEKQMQEQEERRKRALEDERAAEAWRKQKERQAAEDASRAAERREMEAEQKRKRDARSALRVAVGSRVRVRGLAGGALARYNGAEATVLAILSDRRLSLELEGGGCLLVAKKNVVNTMAAGAAGAGEQSQEDSSAGQEASRRQQRELEFVSPHGHDSDEEQERQHARMQKRGLVKVRQNLRPLSGFRAGRLKSPHEEHMTDRMLLAALEAKEKQRVMMDLQTREQQIERGRFRIQTPDTMFVEPSPATSPMKTFDKEERSKEAQSFVESTKERALSEACLQVAQQEVELAKEEKTRALLDARLQAAQQELKLAQEEATLAQAKKLAAGAAAVDEKDAFHKAQDAVSAAKRRFEEAQAKAISSVTVRSNQVCGLTICACMLYMRTNVCTESIGRITCSALRFTRGVRF